MTKQEIIREGIIDVLQIQVGAKQTGDNCYEIQPYWRGRLAAEILSYLDSQGVVLKVEGELPRIPYNSLESYTTTEVDAKCRDTQAFMLGAGYVAVELLIEEKK